MFGLVVEHV